jgi:hypothetical protein
MKNLTTLFLISFIISSCQKLETNSPAFQASIDDVFFKANLTEANYIENEDYFVIQGKNSDEIITLRGANLAEGANIDFGEGSQNFAIYQDVFGVVYSTVVSGGEGRMKINEVSLEDQTLTGEFNFRAISVSQDTLQIKRGVFYKVPYGNETGNDNNAGVFSAELNGGAFVPLDTYAIDNGIDISIKGVINSDEIILVIPADAVSGIYELPFEGFLARVLDGPDTEDAINGEINILSFDTTTKTISGTFQFQTPTNTVNAGQFDVTYQ